MRYRSSSSVPRREWISLAAQPAVRRQRAVGRRERTGRARPAADLRVVRQYRIRRSDGGFDGSVGGFVCRRPDQRDDVWACLAVDQHRPAAEALRDLALDPFRRHVAAEAGDEPIADATVQLQVAVGIEHAKVAGRDFVERRARRITEVAEHRVAGDVHLPCGIDTHAHVRQRTADGAGATCMRACSGTRPTRIR